MALLMFIFRKMARNRWLELNLLFGLTACVALFSSMPMYAGAILQRTLQKELQLLAHVEAVYPGFIRISTTVARSGKDEDLPERIARADRFVRSIPERTGLRALSFYQQRFTERLKVYGADASEQEIRSQNTAGPFKALSGMEKRVRLIDGRMPADRTDGVFEALVTQKFLLAVKRDLGEELIAQSMRDEGIRFRVMPVGIVETDPEADPYLPYFADEISDGFLIPFEQFEREFTQGGKLDVTALEWRYALDAGQLSVDGIDAFLEADRDIRRYFKGRFGVAEVNIPASGTIASFTGRQTKLGILVLSLYAPVMIMLAFYLYMVSGLLIERQKTEIAVLRSRGAGRLQILGLFAFEGLLLGLGALAVGPPLGVLFTKLLGASNEFLSFVRRSALDVALDGGAYRIAAAAAGGAVLLMLLPAVPASGTDIVDRKREAARLTRKPVWHKAGLDFVLVGAAIYLLYGFHRRQEDLKRLALDADDLGIDPLLFLTPALFALGAGLFALRIHPWVVRLVHLAGRRWWSPALYGSLIQVSRSSGQYLTINLFLIMSVATGLFSANAARTINDNLESRIRYDIGADMVLMSRWESLAPVRPAGMAPQQGGDAGGAAGPVRVQYAEPPFEPFRQLEGVASAAKVFRKEEAVFVTRDGAAGKTTLLGIDTKEFGLTAWMKKGLLDHPFNSYLNLIAPNPRAVLISRSIAEEAGVKPGDPIRIQWEGLSQAEFTVYGIIDYWPSWNPLPRGEGAGDERSAKPHLIVGHLGTIQKRLALEPYEVWLKLEDGVSSGRIYDQLAESGVRLVSLRDAQQELIRSRNDPFRLAVNGVMTLGFVISMLILFFGFLIFWTLTLSGRTVQYGVLRAMGLSFREMIVMLASEQVLTSLAAVLIGVLIGNLTSDLFVPLFEMSFAAREQVPPFEVIRQRSDYVQLCAIVGSTLAAGLSVLAVRLARIRIAQALKLGEE